LAGGSSTPGSEGVKERVREREEFYSTQRRRDAEISAEKRLLEKKRRAGRARRERRKKLTAEACPTEECGSMEGSI
jgi:hypothetical protein